jgi:translation initiation factor IF-3
VIGENNEQLGVMPTSEAQRMAREAGLDLVEVAPTVRPPVCRIMNYGKWKYLQKKNTKKHHEQQLKEVRMRPKTDTHDREIKVKQAIKFLAEGDKVQFTMQFRGREQAHREIGYATFRSIIEELGARVKVERTPLVEGRNMLMIVAPVKGAFDGEAAKLADQTKPGAEPVRAAADAGRPPVEPKSAAVQPAAGVAPAPDVAPQPVAAPSAAPTV